MPTTDNDLGRRHQARRVNGPQWPQGHILLEGAPEPRRGLKNAAVFVDLGSVLDLWSGQGATLTPDTARELGEALIEWADRRGAKETGPAAAAPVQARTVISHLSKGTVQ